MNTRVSVREAHLGDAPALVRLLAQLGYPGSAEFIERRIVQLLSHADARLLVAQADASVVGFISLHIVPQLALAADFCRVSYLCIDESVRGLGIGALLEHRAEQCARELGCDRIELHSSAQREAAHRFYFRQGYQESPKYLVKRLGEQRDQAAAAPSAAARNTSR
ncbi:MAG: GNAT family N-acetyltransferase [Ramlibacter sp.]